MCTNPTCHMPAVFMWGPKQRQSCSHQVTVCNLFTCSVIHCTVLTLLSTQDVCSYSVHTTLLHRNLPSFLQNHMQTMRESEITKAHL